MSVEYEPIYYINIFTTLYRQYSELVWNMEYGILLSAHSLINFNILGAYKVVNDYPVMFHNPVAVVVPL